MVDAQDDIRESATDTAQDNKGSRAVVVNFDWRASLEQSLRENAEIWRELAQS